uniref:DUF2817 domain-containing protein n=1 Tax=Chromera velia CCMP2878 TaxID=1169474 RepID=A0A0G4HK32_9ALVE|eukprot:Cvel_28346.t1-p1 / transcript=Cvel_28346.t1 / gene=Cvel_28346 / organism=Chromera_velia_CCMP2878 / gene_product=hypothetical protein / transcript_product=hypothetical protein / location=Cvel_scaffold3689:9332-13883(+) / protein_length=426 / sequence_SO=supercontig / SO=protein_coding / is_pseudo=false
MLREDFCVECFSSTYEEAREKFLTAAETLKDKGSFFVDVQSFPLDIPDTTGVFIDICQIRKKDSTQPPTFSKCLVHSSGVHGVEGFAGSAVQVGFLRLLVDASVPLEFALSGGDAGIVLIHAVNPYGFKTLRRWNENNVDLNRNWLLGSGEGEDMTAHQKQPRNNPYAELHPIVAPSGPVPTSAAGLWLDEAYMKSRSLWILLTRGRAATAQALAPGQYQSPEGLFYGGAKLEAGPEITLTYLKGVSLHVSNAKLEKVIHIDVHTGLGPFGWDSLLSLENEEIYVEKARKVFGDGHIPKDLKSIAYGATGSFPAGFAEFVGRGSSLCITQEFGTKPPLEVVTSLRYENWVWQNDRRTPTDHPAKQRVLDAFYPRESPAWKSSVVCRGMTLVVQALSDLGLVYKEAAADLVTSLDPPSRGKGCCGGP